MHPLYYLSLILLAGLFLARVVNIFKLPNVTGYILAGMLIGPSFLGIIPREAVSSFNIISEVALGFIAYSIGGELNIKHLRRMGSSVLVITLTESLGAVLVVIAAMALIFRQPLTFSFIIGSIAAATAPAATIMVIRQYNAKGPLVDTLFPVVALDDAVAIMVFGIAVGISHSLPTASTGVIATVVLAGRLVLEIVIALGLGFCVGLFLSVVSRYLRGHDTLLSFVIACILLTIGVAYYFNVSSLLSCLALGATVTNLVYRSDRVLSVVDRFTPPIFVSFFCYFRSGFADFGSARGWVARNRICDFPNDRKSFRSLFGSQVDECSCRCSKISGLGTCPSGWSGDRAFAGSRKGPSGYRNSAQEYSSWLHSYL